MGACALLLAFAIALVGYLRADVSLIAAASLLGCAAAARVAGVK